MDVDCGSARDRLGQTVGGRYRLDAVLGAGGTAVVYLASDLSAGVSTDGEVRKVAIKVLHDHLSRLEEVRRRFAREGNLSAILDHPSTVKVLDDGMTDEGSPFLVLEYLEGESLEDRRVRAGGRLDVWETLDYCDQLLAVLEVAHSKNVIHRDIKPANLFLTKDGVLKVLDFGIARVTDDASATATKTGQTVGTPAFMPPEQALSRPRDVDERTDIWSVSATLFTLLSGEHVHLAETSSEHLVKAATLHARSLAKALKGVPANVEALVARGLAFDKNERWPSAAAMRAELSEVRADPGRRIGTSTSPPPDRASESSNITFLLGLPSSGTLGADRPSDTGMSVSSKPGPDSPSPPLPLPRRRWLLPVAIASTLGLVVMTAVVLVLAVRGVRPSEAAEHDPNNPNGPLVSVPGSPGVGIPPLSEPEPPASVAALTIAPAPAETAPAASPTSSAPPPALSSVSPGRALRPPAKKAGPRRDVYRPF